MQSPDRDPSMEDILASIKKVIAEEKELRTAAKATPEPVEDPLPEEAEPIEEEDVLELDEPLAPPVTAVSFAVGRIEPSASSTRAVFWISGELMP